MSARTFPGRLAAALAASGKTQGWLAGELGRSEGTVSHWCSGRSRPAWEDVERIAKLLGVEPGPLVFGARRGRRASTGEQPAARRPAAVVDAERSSWTGTEG